MTALDVGKALSVPGVDAQELELLPEEGDGNARVRMRAGAELIERRPGVRPQPGREWLARVRCR